MHAYEWYSGIVGNSYDIFYNLAKKWHVDLIVDNFSLWLHDQQCDKATVWM